MDQDTWLCIFGQERHAAHKCYLQEWPSYQFQPLTTQKLLGQLPPIFFLSYIVPHIPNLQEIMLAVPEMGS